MRRAMLLLLILCSAAARAQEPADWIEFPGASAELVPEAVFGGRVMLYQAGRRGTQVPGQVVVLVHGLSKSGARDWSKLIPALAERYQVFALDLPGFGQSDKGNHLYSPDNYAVVIEQVMAPRVSVPFTLVGHSMGGAVSLAYVAAYPQRVARLVLVDTAGVLHRTVYSEFLARVGAQRAMGIELPWYDSVVRAIQLHAERVPLRGDLILRHPAVRQRLLRGEPNAIAAYALSQHDFSQGLRAITAPTLVIWGAEDPVAPLRTGQALASVIRGARLTVIEGAGHVPQQQLSQRFNPIVLDELDGRQVAAPPYLLPRGTIPDGRVGRCAGQRAQEFSGDYERIELEHCADASIADARVGTLRAAHSAVRVVNSHIRDGIDALNSRLELNGGSVGGSLVLDAASVDAAGVRFEPVSALATNNGSVQAVLRLSVSEVSTAGRAPRYLQEIIRLAPGETLIR
jgi:pimeloyl-ACP methyl ester carboxylesterase